MISSSIGFEHGRVRLIIDGERVPACAYITYFDERTCCDDFARAGYRIFSLCASFCSLPLNSTTGFAPLHGIFDVEGRPDYSRFDRNVRKILRCCPNAVIFPRVRISMPAWWNERHPDDTCLCPDGNHREALFSDAFRADGAALLRQFIAHVRSSDYAEHVIGYQLAGGDTEEWFHFDAGGSHCGRSKQKFNEYLHRNYPSEYEKEVELPDASAFGGRGLLKDPLARRYLEFINCSVAQTIAYFARVAKECVGHRQLVGAFYGYAQTISNARRGSIGLWQLLQCPDVDFFCSPASYTDQRALGIDWGEHSVSESIKRHGKLYFMENDIRTCLSDYPDNCRAGVDPQGRYCSPLWLGPPTKEESVWAMRKAYARQLTHDGGLWWFDMWGGWYADPVLMREAEQCLSLMTELAASDAPIGRAHIAVLFDEKYTCRVGNDDPCYKIQKQINAVLGNTGFTFDALLTEDYRESLHYQAVLLPFPTEYDSEETRRIKDFLRERKIPFVQLRTADAAITADELRARLLETGAHCYCHSGDVIYHGGGVLAIHAASAEKKEIRLPHPATVTPLDPPGEPFVSDKIVVKTAKFETKTFKTEYKKEEIS